MYRERPSQIAGSVVWRRLIAAEDVRIDPDGCMDLIWSADGALLVAGPDTRPHVFAGPGQTLVGVRFGSGIGPLVLGVPAHALADQRVPLEAIWPADEARRLAERVAAGPIPGRALEIAAAERLEHTDGPDPAMAEVVRLLRLGGRIREVAATIGLSERQLHRRSLDAFGYGRRRSAGSSASRRRSTSPGPGPRSRIRRWRPATPTRPTSAARPAR